MDPDKNNNNLKKEIDDLFHHSKGNPTTRVHGIDAASCKFLTDCGQKFAKKYNCVMEEIGNGVTLNINNRKYPLIHAQMRHNTVGVFSIEFSTNYSVFNRLMETRVWAKSETGRNCWCEFIHFFKYPVNELLLCLYLRGQFNDLKGIYKQVIAATTNTEILFELPNRSVQIIQATDFENFPFPLVNEI